LERTDEEDYCGQTGCLPGGTGHWFLALAHCAKRSESRCDFTGTLLLIVVIVIAAAHFQIKACPS
jgi:hypothetical protein